MSAVEGVIQALTASDPRALVKLWKHWTLLAKALLALAVEENDEKAEGALRDAYVTAFYP